MSFFFLSACIGRNSDRLGSQVVEVEKLGLQKNKPAVLSFSAVWCKPCRAEIPVLNQAARDFGEKLQIQSFLVEGHEKGELPTANSLTEFLGPSKEIPIFSLSLDPEWRLYDQMPITGGRQLPTLLLVNARSEVAMLFQRSLEYDSELKPLLSQLVLGQDINQPLTPPTDPSGTQQSIPIKDWVQMPGQDTTTALYASLQSAWEAGCTQFGFTSEDMPFLDGKISYFVKDGKNLPSSMYWSHLGSTGLCTLTVKVNVDGSFLSATGVCR